MSIYTKPLRLDIIYWPKVDNTTFGRPDYGAPIQLKGRWDDYTEEIWTDDKRKVISKAIIMLSEDVKAGGLLQLATLSDPPPTKPPTEAEGAFEIIKFNKSGNIKQTKFVRLAYV